MKVLFCGLGSIGKRHARLLQQYFPQHELAAFRTGKGQEQNDLGIAELHSWAEVDRRPFEAAFITSPTFLHIQYATECAKRRMHLFIEKPIDCTTTGLDALLDLIRAARLTAYVAYPLRFHPVMRALRPLVVQEPMLHSRSVCASYLPAWRPGQNHLASYSARRDQGGGVLLDLSHDIDLLQYLFGDIETLTGTMGRRSSVTVDAEDYADLAITHRAGRSTLHLNYFSRSTERSIAIDTAASHIHADLVKNTITYTGAETWTRAFPFERDEMYRDQLQYFFTHCADPALENNLADASRLFRKLIAYRDQG